LGESTGAVFEGHPDSTTAAIVALQRETRTIPIGFASVAEPVATGIVARLGRPSGNITGFATSEASLGAE
jgi:putative ABC transport system substrate-binding protein